MFANSIFGFDDNRDFQPLGYDRPTDNYTTGANCSDGYSQPLTYTPLSSIDQDHMDIEYESDQVLRYMRQNESKFDSYGSNIVPNEREVFMGFKQSLPTTALLKQPAVILLRNDTTSRLTAFSAEQML